MFKRFLRVALFLGCLLTTNISYASGINIFIPEQVFVNKAQLTLGDIAEIIGADNAKVETLKKVNLGSAPSPGSRMVLNNELLGMRISAASLNYNDVTWYIPDNITIIAKSQTISGQELLVTAQNYIKSNIPQAITDYTIENVNLPQDLLIREGTVTLKPVLPYGVRYNAPTNVFINVMVDDVLVKKVELRFNVKRYEQVVVLTNPLMPNQIITGADLAIVRVDISKIPQGYINDINKIIGKVVLRVLAAETVLNNGMLYNPIIINKASTVEIVYQNNGIEVRAVGTALQDGREGEMIRVQNEDSKKIISGLVFDESPVLIKGK